MLERQNEAGFKARREFLPRQAEGFGRKKIAIPRLGAAGRNIRAPPALRGRASEPFREINGLFLFGGNAFKQTHNKSPPAPGPAALGPRNRGGSSGSFPVPGAQRGMGTASDTGVRHFRHFPQSSPRSVFSSCSKTAFSNHAASFFLLFLFPKWVSYGGFVCVRVFLGLLLLLLLRKKDPSKSPSLNPAVF